MEESLANEESVVEDTQTDVSVLGFRKSVTIVMRARGLSNMAEVCRNAGVSEHYLTNKGAMPSIRTIQHFATSLNVTPGLLLELAICDDDGMWDTEA